MGSAATGLLTRHCLVTSGKARLHSHTIRGNSRVRHTRHDVMSKRTWADFGCMLNAYRMHAPGGASERLALHGQE